jgi:hypothetical protein
LHASQDPDFNIFAGVSLPEYQEMRKLIIDAILQTDMACHFDLVAKFAARFVIVRITFQICFLQAEETRSPVKRCQRG